MSKGNIKNCNDTSLIWEIKVQDEEKNKKESQEKQINLLWIKYVNNYKNMLLNLIENLVDN